MNRKQNIIIALLVVIIVILISPALIFAAVYNSSMKQMALPPAPTKETTGDPVLDQDLFLVQNAKDIARSHMPGFLLNWTFDPEARVAEINAIRRDYAGYYVENAKDSPDAYLDDWNNSVARAVAAQKHIQRYFDQSEADDITAVVNIMDYDDRETVYLTVANGIVGYDAVNGIDLRGGGG